MVFRLPTPFDTIVPSSSSMSRTTRSRPWRGSFILHGINLFHSPSGQQRLLVASAETEGDNRTDLWPKQFDVHVAQHASRLADVQGWVTRNDIPLCMFMPDRHASSSVAGGTGSGPGGSNTSANEAHFRALSRMLIENQLICVAPWPTSGYHETAAGAGLLIIPTTASTGLLIGAIFINSSFPDFISLLPGGTEAIPSGLPSASSSFSSVDLAFTSSYARLPDPGPYSSGPPPQGHGDEQSQGQGSTNNASAWVQYRDASPAFMHPFTMSPDASSAAAIANSYNKLSMDGFANDSALRAALTVAPFDWAMFDETDGSGSTSPGSTRTW